MKKETRVRHIKIIAVGLAFIGVFGLLAAGQTAVRLKVSAEQANIREKPDIGSPMVEQLPEGTILEAQSKEGEWYFVGFVRRDGSIGSGYIHESLVLVIAQDEEKPESLPAEKKIEPPAIEKVEVEKPLQTEEEKTEGEKRIGGERIETGAGGGRESTAALFRRPPGEQRLRLSIHLSGELMSPGDINSGTTGIAEAYEASLGTNMNGTIGTLHIASGGGAEVEYALTSGLYAGFGLGFFRGARGSLVDFPVGNIPEVFRTRPALQAVPVKIGLSYYFLPAFYVKGSLEYILAGAKYLYRYEKKDIWLERQGKAHAGNLGAEIAVGGEWAYSSKLALFGEAGFRMAKIHGFSGKDVIIDSKGLSSEIEGTLYYYLVRFAMDTYFPRLFVRESMPTEAGVMDAREAVVNLTGLSLRFGLRIRL
jgi:hypothetical protein